MEGWTKMTTQKSAQFVVSNENPFLQKNPMSALANPFAPKNLFAPPSDEVPADAPEGSYTYKLVKNGPEVSAEECESNVASIEIVIRWGANVLHVAHLTPPRSFYVGEEQGKANKCDFFLPEEKLGARRIPLLLKDQRGDVRLVIPAGATGSITLPGDKSKPLADVLAGGEVSPSAELAGAHEIALVQGTKADLEVGGINFSISTVNAGRAVAGRFQLDGQSLPYQALSLLLHVGLLAATAIFMPQLAMANEDEGMTDEQKYLIATKLDAIAERDLPKNDEQLVDNQVTGDAGGTGAQAKGDSGKMGSMTSNRTNGRFGIEGPKDNQDVRLSRAQALRDAADFGMLGLLHAGMGGDPNTPTVLWGREDTLGNDAKSALGNMWGKTIDEAGGAGGLGLTGVGESGGGLFEGIGLGRGVDTIGHGAGPGNGNDFGFGRDHGVLRGGHTAKAPVVRVGTASVSGHLPSEVIQRIVRQNFGRFKLCYQNGLRTNPSLQGRVAVRFIIGHDGGVSSVANGGSDLPDSSVTSCVERAFYGLSFPHPDSGIVTVTYPIVFSPAN
jgi:hypothetical protein